MVLNVNIQNRIKRYCIVATQYIIRLGTFLQALLAQKMVHFF